MLGELMERLNKPGRIPPLRCNTGFCGLPRGRVASRMRSQTRRANRETVARTGEEGVARSTSPICYLYMRFCLDWAVSSLSPHADPGAPGFVLLSCASSDVWCK